MLYIATDHRGFELKEKLKTQLENNGVAVEDLGAYTFEPEDDYPVFAERIGSKVREDSANLGILLCGSGVGAVAAVNKIHGIRASVGLSPEQVRAGRHDDDMNVLVIAADFTSKEQASTLVDAFLNTQFNKATPRYQRRIDQITKLEQHG